MAACVIEMAAGPAKKLAEIEMLTALTAPRTQEPRHCPVSPDHRDSDPFDQKIGSLSGELITSFTPPELRRGALHERTDPVQLECVEACPVLDEAIGREVRSVVVTEPIRRFRPLSCPISLTLPVSLRPSSAATPDHDEERDPVQRPHRPQSRPADTYHRPVRARSIRPRTRWGVIRTDA